MYNIHRDTIPSSAHILFSKSFTNISYFTPDVNSNFKFDKKLHFWNHLPTILLGYMPIPEFNYQNNYSYSNFYTSHIHQISHFILCVYPRKQDSCVRRMQGYIYVASPTSFLCVCVIILIVSSLPLFVCLRVECWVHTGFVG